MAALNATLAVQGGMSDQWFNSGLSELIPFEQEQREAGEARANPDFADAKAMLQESVIDWDD